MKATRAIAVLATAAAATAIVGAVGMASATAANPVALSSSSPLETFAAGAFNISSTGGLYSAPANKADCVGYPTFSHTLPTLSIPGLATASVLTAGCAVSDESEAASATANIARVNLLGGKVVITGLRSQCKTDAEGNTTVQSSIATLNGIKVATGPVKIVLPGLISVYLDKNTETVVPGTDGSFTRMESIGVEVVVPPMTTTLLGHTHTTPGLDVIVGECHIDGSPFEGGGEGD